MYVYSVVLKSRVTVQRVSILPVEILKTVYKTSDISRFGGDLE
jgi:hypothetical protein